MACGYFPLLFKFVGGTLASVCLLVLAGMTYVSEMVQPRSSNTVATNTSRLHSPAALLTWLQLLAKVLKQGRNIVHSSPFFQAAFVTLALVIGLLTLLHYAITIYQEQQEHVVYLRQISLFHKDEEVRRLADGMADFVEKFDPLPSVFGISIRPTLRNVVLTTSWDHQLGLGLTRPDTIEKRAHRLEQKTQKPTQYTRVQ